MYVLSNEKGHYFTGDTYVVQGERYAVADERDTKKAKIYSTEKRAINALKSLGNKCGNYTFEVEEIKG